MGYRKLRKADAAMLLLLTAAVVLAGGAFRIGGREHAKMVMCSINQKSIGQAMSVYSDSYDGLMPYMETYTENGKWYGQNCMRAHFCISKYDYSAGQVWQGLGGLFKAGLISDGRSFYCPSAPGAMDEYLSYSSPAPWGNNLQLQSPNNPGNGNVWLRITKGYIYWPQGRLPVLPGFRSPYSPYPLGYPESSSGWGRYAVGKPAPPLKYADLGPGYALTTDGTAHTGQTGYQMVSLFGDGHVNMQKAQQYLRPSDGKLLWIRAYQCGLPAGANPADWYGDGSTWDNVTMICNWIYMLQP
jgi:hypothetical protein